MEHTLKLWLIEQYIEDQEILHILPHARLRYLILTLQYCVGVVIVGLIWEYSGGRDSLQRVMGIIGIMAFGKYIHDFLDIYLDSVVLTNRGVTIVRIDGWFRYKVDFFERKNIISVSHSQGGIVDKIFNNWSVKIALDHDSDYTISGVAWPDKQSSIINKYKFEALDREKELEEIAAAQIMQQPDKFEILVDTLSDVIGAYMRQDRNEE